MKITLPNLKSANLVVDRTIQAHLNVEDHYRRS